MPSRIASAVGRPVGTWIRITKRVVRSTRVPIAERFPAPMMQSPSQCPTCIRSSASAGRSAIIVMLVSRPRRSRPWTRRRRRRRRRLAGRVTCDPGIVDRLVDRLRTQVALGLIREPHPQFVGDLFGTPPLAQQTRRRHHGAARHRAKRRVARRPGSPLGAQPLRRGRQVAAATISVAAKLPRHRRGRPAQLVGDVAHTHTRTMQISDRRPLGQRQISRMPRLWVL